MIVRSSPSISRSGARVRPVRAALCSVLAAVLLSGCYRYTEADRSAIGAGDEVVLTLSEGRVEGRVVAIGDTAVTLSRARPARERFRTGATAVDTVRVATARVRSIRRKELEAGNTAILVGGAAAGVGVAAVLLFESVSGGGGGSGSPGDGVDRSLWPYP